MSRSAIAQSRVRHAHFDSCLSAADIHTAFTNPPFKISEEGWGEFDLEIILTGTEKGGDHPISHDLNFQSPRYEAKHTVVSSPQGTSLFSKADTDITSDI